MISEDQRKHKKTATIAANDCLINWLPKISKASVTIIPYGDESIREVYEINIMIEKV